MLDQRVPLRHLANAALQGLRSVMLMENPADASTNQRQRIAIRQPRRDQQNAAGEILLI